MDMMSYGKVLHSYANTVLSGHSDADLTPNQRYILGCLVNLAGNDTYAPYPPTEEVRTAVGKKLGDFTWNAGCLFRGKARDDFEVAKERAFEVIRNV